MSLFRSSVPFRAAFCGVLLFASACADAVDETAAPRVCQLCSADRADEETAIGKGGPDEKQARASSLVGTAKVRELRVRVDSSIPSGGGVDDWRAAVRAATDVYNDVPNNLVRMTYVVTGPADITFLSDEVGTEPELGDDTAADATLPVNGLAGDRVRVNLDLTVFGDFDAPLTHEQKLFIAVHELGHCIGLRHTNWRIWDQGDPDAIDIPGTPTTDGASVMNAGTAGDSFVGLSASDSLAIRTIYPEIVAMVVEYTGCPSGTPRMAATWGGTLVQPTLEWQLERKVGTTWSQVYLGTGSTWSVNVPTGTSLQLRVRGRSAEGWSLWRTISKTAPSCGSLPQ
ncbi:MAG TPA: M57 family metalloprotease [Kofleriaceae bacterium]|nr:M57 family metalloprotease [Kofleriaceae bacterium]